MADVVVIGGGGHARVLIATLLKQGVNVTGYVAREDTGPISGVPFRGSDEVLGQLDPAQVELAMGIGMVEPSDLREKLATSALEMGFRFFPVVSQDATVADDAALEEGAVVFAGAVVQPGCTLGRFSIVNTHATVDHDGVIGAFSHIAPGATVCGEVKVGSCAMVGAGSTIVPGCNVGDRVLVGAGAVVIESCLDAGTYVGVPARKVS